MKLIHLLFISLLLVLGTAVSAAAPASTVPDDLPFSASYVLDMANILPSESGAREGTVQVRLRQFEGAAQGKMSLHVYTLKNAGGLSTGTFVREIYNRWVALPDQKDYVEQLAVIFVFADEREARVSVANDALPELRRAVQGIAPQQLADIGHDTEPAMLQIIDRIAANLNIPSDYSKPPPLPADPGGPIYGSPTKNSNYRAVHYANMIQDTDLPEIAAAIENASRQAGHPVVLVLNPERNFYSYEQIADHMAEVWHDRTLLLLYQGEDRSGVYLRPAGEMKGRLSEKTAARIENDILSALTATRNSDGGMLVHALIRTIGEIGAIGGGHPPQEWSPWRHPILALAGGPDADPFVGFVKAIFIAGFLILGGFWVLFFIKDPREATVGLVFFILQAFLSGGGGEAEAAAADSPGAVAARGAAAPPAAGRGTMIFLSARNKFLQLIDMEAIEEAIRKAEQNTTGEIRVSIIPRVLGSLEAFAEKTAKRLGMTETTGRNGVLILVEPAQRRFIIWGDKAIHEKVGQKFWIVTADAIAERFRAQDFTHGLLHGVETAGRQLAVYFPSAPDGHKNQLPNSIDIS